MRSVRPYLTWLRRGALVMALLASVVGVAMAVWFAFATWRGMERAPHNYSVAVSFLGFGLTNLLVAEKVRDGEFTSPLRHFMICVVCVVTIAMTIKVCGYFLVS